MSPFLKNLLFTGVVPGTVAVYIPLVITRNRPPSPDWAVALSLPAFAAGAAIYVWCVWDFAAFGGGTPAPADSPKRLVIRGPYQYTRNPMYIGVLTVVLAWALLFQAAVMLLYVALVGFVFHSFVVLYEEPHLHQTFGEEYDSYRARVNRWLPKYRG